LVAINIRIARGKTDNSNPKGVKTAQAERNQRFGIGAPEKPPGGGPRPSAKKIGPKG